MNRVLDKIVMVTGAGSGIGRAAAVLLASEGAVVAVTDVNDAGGMAVVDEIIQSGGKAKFWHLDTTIESEVEDVIHSVGETYGRIDGLVNNAGVGGTAKPTQNVTLDEFNSVMNVNVTGVFLCSKHVIPYMLKNGGGSVVNISSLAGLVGAPYMSAYCSSKGAVRLMTKADAMTYADKKIRFNSVHPGFIYTPMVESFLKERVMSRESLDAFAPLGHMGEPSDVAYGILYLISDESKFSTGSELVIDGGSGAR